MGKSIDQDKGLAVGPSDSKNIRQLTDALNENPDDESILWDLAEKYVQMGLFARESLDIYRRAAAIDPLRSDTGVALRITLVAEEIRDFIQKSAIDFVSPSSPAYTNPTLVEEHINLVKNWLEKWGGSADIYKILGDLYMLRRRFTVAMGAYRKARNMGFRPSAAILETIEKISNRASIPGPPAVYFAQIALENGQDAVAEPLLHGALKLSYMEGRRMDSDMRLFNGMQEEDQNYQNHAREMLLDIMERRRGRLKSRQERENLILEMARLHLDQGDPQGAARKMTHINIADCDNRAMIKELAGSLIEIKDYKQSFDFLKQLPMDGDVKQMLAKIKSSLQEMGEIDTAAYLNEFIKENHLVLRESRRAGGRERASQTQMAMGDFHFENNRLDKALERYAEALRSGYPDPGEALHKIHAVLERTDATPPGQLLLDVGDYCAAHDDPEQAVTFFLMLLDQEPQRLEVRRRLRQMYDLLLSHNPNRPSIRLRSGDLYLLLRNFNLAVEEYKYAAQFPQCEQRATQRMIGAYIQSRNLSLAVDCYESLELRPEDYETLYDLVTQLEEKRLYGEALRACRLLRNEDPEYKDIAERFDRLESKMDEIGQDAYVDPKMKKLIGDNAIGRYRYIEKIGSGGMGAVHKVRDLTRQEDVAMKILREGVAQSGKAVNRFFREARIAATLNHENIVLIHDYNLNPISGQSYIVMEYVGGSSLRGRIEDRMDCGHELTSESIAEDLGFCAQICQALEASAARGIIHRDIKPDNILLSPSNIVKITDFGIMHIQNATFTPSGALVGTPRYMAPEQVEGKKVDARSDLYSAGIIIYELLVGTPPFVSGDVSYQQVHVEPTPPAEIYPDIPDHVNKLILKSLQKKPEDRFQTAIEMRDALHVAISKLTTNSFLSKIENLKPRPPSGNGTDTGG